MKDWIFNVVPVISNMIITPEITAGIVESTTRLSRIDWKLADNRRKITRIASPSPMARFVSVSCMGAI
jgi:hypothetical protein